jgi:excisionase family DNA binding protein
MPCKPESSGDGFRTSRATAGAVEQVAKVLNISRDKVYYLLRTRQLRSIKIGKSRRITDAHLAAFLASLEGDDAA